MVASNTSTVTEEEIALGLMVGSNTSTTEEERALKNMIRNNITTMILKRLPVKSLIRFKTASKSFCRFICSPEFFMVHSLYSQLKRSPQLLFRLHDVDLRWEGMNFRLVYKFCMTDLRGNILSVFYARLRQDPIRFMLPSSLGLLCLATEKGIWLCNPSIRENVELPPCPCCNPDDRLLGIGFGYLVPLKGFKVVQLMLRANCLRPQIDCWVFNLTNSGGSWRLMRECCPYLVSERSRPAFVQETIYWKIDRRFYTKLQRDNDFLVAFNIREEMFRLITHPECWTYTADSKVHIAEIAGSLFMMVISDSCVNIWYLADQNNCIWFGMLCHAPGRPVRVAELRSYIELNRLYVFSSSQENAVLLYGRGQETFYQVVVPFNAIDFTTYFEGLYSPRN